MKKVGSIQKHLIFANTNGDLKWHRIVVANKKPVIIIGTKSDLRDKLTENIARKSEPIASKREWEIPEILKGMT